MVNQGAEPPIQSNQPECAVEKRPGDPRIRDKMMDKTLADSFPTSDPPSSIPDPCEDSFGEDKAA